MKNKAIILLLVSIVILMNVPLFAAYEAHVMSVTARIEDPVFAKRATGPTKVPTSTYQEWVFTFRIHNKFDYPMKNIEVKDRFGANLDVVFVSKNMGDYFQETNVPGNQQRFKWTIAELAPGKLALLILKVSTSLNPSGKQEYTSPGAHELNSGAVLKWLDLTGAQQSLTTGPMSITAYKP